MKASKIITLAFMMAIIVSPSFSSADGVLSVYTRISGNQGNQGILAVYFPQLSASDIMTRTNAVIRLASRNRLTISQVWNILYPRNAMGYELLNANNPTNLEYFTQTVLFYYVEGSTVFVNDYTVDYVPINLGTEILTLNGITIRDNWAIRTIGGTNCGLGNTCFEP